MCFSAEASFTAAAVLLPAGGIAMQRAARRDMAYLPIATLPMLFGLQQLCEGAVWMAGRANDTATVEASSLAYMFFSYFAWPVWVPFSTYFLEPQRRRSLYLMFVISGAMLAGIEYVPYFTHKGWLTTRLRLRDRLQRHCASGRLDAPRADISDLSHDRHPFPHHFIKPEPETFWRSFDRSRRRHVFILYLRLCIGVLLWRRHDVHVSGLDGVSRNGGCSEIADTQYLGAAS